MPLRVLLLTPQFYGIEKKIKSNLERSDYEVVWIENKTLLLDFHGTRSKLKFLRRIYFFLFAPQSRYISTEFKKIANPQFDILFAINAHVVNYQLFRKLKKINPGLISILYLWDSFRMYNWEKEIIGFDKVYTFDPDDALKYGLFFKPNFFLKNNDNLRPEYDLFFVGKYSSERLSLIDKLLELPDLKDLKLFIKLWPAYRIFLHNHLVYNLFKILKSDNEWIRKYQDNYEAIEGITEREYLTNTSFSFDDMQTNLHKSNVILDIPVDYQSGYTHRVIDALANGKKVLTTNQNIINEAFYNPDQIHVLDPQSLEIDANWIRTKSIFSVHEYFQDLELSVWLKSILNASIA